MKLKVLIVDDDEIFLLVHRTLVQQAGLASDPVTLLNGQQVLDYLDENAGQEYDYLILLDINMPEINAWQLLDRINQRQYPHRLHVVIVTSSINPSDKHKAEEYKQVIDYVSKPLTNHKLTSLKGRQQFRDFFI